MAKGKVLIGSKLPNGVVLRHPLNPAETVTIRGLNSAGIGQNGLRLTVPYMTTEIDSEFWEAWKMVHNHETRPFKPLASSAIFEAKTEDAAKGIAKEQAKRSTGLEPMPQTGAGIKPAEKE